MPSDRWRVEKSGPDWLMDAGGRLLGYRDERGFEHLIPNSPISGGATNDMDVASPVSGAGNSAAKVSYPIVMIEEDGTVVQRKMPAAARIVKQGARLWAPTASGTGGAPVTDASKSNAAYAGARQVLLPASTQPPVVLTSLAGSYTSFGWTGQNFAMPSDGLLQLLVYLDDYQMGGAPFSTGIDVIVSGASGGVEWKFSMVALRPGLNTIQLWNPATPANAVCHKAGVSYVNGVPTYNFTDAVTGVTIRFPNAAVNQKVCVYGLWSQAKVKPMVALTFDTSAANIFTNFVPAWAAAGLKATLRAGGTDFYRQETAVLDGKSWAQLLLEAQNNSGMSINNGSLSRANLTSATTAAALLAEVIPQTNWQRSKGLNKGSTMFGSAGNALAAAATNRANFPKAGIKTAKGSGGYQATFCGPAGFDDPYFLTAVGYAGRSDFLAKLAGIEMTGGLLLAFGHECPAYGSSPPPDTGSPGNGGGMYAEDAAYFATYLAGRVAAGALETVGAEELDLILDGLA